MIFIGNIYSAKWLQVHESAKTKPGKPIAGEGVAVLSCEKSRRADVATSENIVIIFTIGSYAHV